MAACLLLGIAVSSGICKENEIDAVLTSAETFFKALKDKKYVQTWSLLSAKSKDTIINDIYRETGSSGMVYTKEQIASDMNAGGMIAAGYWKGILESFDPRIVLENSQWDIGYIREREAEIKITQKKSTNPARLQMFKENGGWKVGLVETFWSRK